MLSELPTELKLEILSFLPSLKYCPEPNSATNKSEIKKYYGKFKGDPTKQVYNIFNMYPKIKKIHIIHNKLLISGAIRVEIDITYNQRKQILNSYTRDITQICNLKKKNFIVGPPKSFVFITNFQYLHLPSLQLMNMPKIHVKVVHQSSQGLTIKHPQMSALKSSLRSLDNSALKRVDVDLKFENREVTDSFTLNYEELRQYCRLKVTNIYTWMYNIGPENMQNFGLLAPCIERAYIRSSSWRNVTLDRNLDKCTVLDVYIDGLEDEYHFVDNFHDVLKHFPNLEKLKISLNSQYFLKTTAGSIEPNGWTHPTTIFGSFCRNIFIKIVQCDLKYVCFNQFLFDDMQQLISDYKKINPYNIQNVSFWGCVLQNVPGIALHENNMHRYISMNIKSLKYLQHSLYEIMDHFIEKVQMPKK